MIVQKQRSVTAWVLALGLTLFSRAVSCAADFYVSPMGTADGPGSRSHPYDLRTVLTGLVAQAGDSIWLGSGTYHLGHVDTQIHGTPTRPITIRGEPAERVEVIGSLTLWGEARHVVFRDFELCGGGTKRVSNRKDAGFSPSDLPGFVEGIQVYVPNCSFINLVVHDTVRSAFYTSTSASNTLIYGCVVYNTGWASPDNAEGHSFYLQGSGEAAENIACNSTGAGFHVYANGKGERLRDLVMEGNVAFGAGALQNVRPYRDWLVGVDWPAVAADRIILRQNMGYCIANPTTLPQVQLGREQLNGQLVLSSNYWPQGLILNKWQCPRITGNVLAPQSGSFTNTYVFVRPSRYEAGRANIVVYNWTNLRKVSVDLSHVVPNGMSYEIRNAQDFFATPVSRGVFDGRPLELPMTGLTVATPTGGLKTPRVTGPRFNVFVVLPAKAASSPLAARQAARQREPEHYEK